MAWLKRFYRFLAKPSLNGRNYQICCTLFSNDGKRAAEIREFDTGGTYILESEWTEGGVFKARFSGRLVGPFPNPVDAEHFIIGTDWFNGTAA
ncbi:MULTISPECIES: hypothetical protein [unclassified Novosphingobium]|uniref:hypothetical protein n=1 Tax=unclassified Novosphingobium TaxID=2644732 RepID=UPI0025DB6952|nr:MULTISPECIES: hypothetical protein [unclassified Novosphingobium]